MKTAILIGGGNSINEGVSKGLWSHIQGKDIWSINYAFMTMPYLPTREIFVDIAFFKNNTEMLQLLHNQGVKIYSKQHMNYANLQQEIHQYNTTREKTGYRGKDVFHTNNHLFIGRMGLSGMFALSLAIAEHYETIYLLGYDFGRMEGEVKTHYYQDKIQVISSGVGHPEVYVTKDGKTNKEVSDFEIYTKEQDLKILNVSLKSNIPYFPKISWEDFFERIKCI